MNNDRIQGILFDQSELLDLVPKTRKQKFLIKLTTTKHTLRSWRVKPSSPRRLSPLSAHSLLASDLSKKQYDYEMSELVNRLKDRA